MPDDQTQLADALAKALTAVPEALADELQALRAKVDAIADKLDRALDHRADDDEVRAWSVKDWCAITSIGLTKAYELINDQSIESVKHGHSRLILTPPSTYLQSLRPRIRRPA